MDSTTAYDILRNCGIPLNEDFHKLSATTVQDLADYGKMHKYRKPANANGSYARMFYAYITRKANAKRWAQ